MKTRLIAFCMILVALVACSSSNGKEPELVGATGQALSHNLTVEPLSYIEGTYQGCQKRTDGEIWQVALNAPDPSWIHSKLRVVLGDTNCHLNLTKLYGPMHPAQEEFDSAAPLPILNTYALTATAFTTVGDNPVYANVKIDDLAFDNDFVITVKYSSDIDDETVSVGTTQIVSGTAVSERVPAPNYDTTVDTSNMSLESDVSGVITVGGGSLIFNAVGQTAERYKVVVGALPSYEWTDVNTAAAGSAAFSGEIPFSSFGLHVGDTLPFTSTLILVHTEDGVSSYQTLTITFQ